MQYMSDVLLYFRDKLIGRVLVVKRFLQIYLAHQTLNKSSWVLLMLLTHLILPLSYVPVMQECCNHLELCDKQATSSQLESHEPEFYDWFISEESSVVMQSVWKNVKLGDLL